jgi:hypothetical protein
VWRSYLRAIFYLAGLVFLSRNAGEMTHPLGQTFALLCFAIFCLTYIERRTSRRQLGLLVPGVVLLVAGLTLLRAEPPMAVASLALATVGLWFVAEGSGVAVDDLAAYALTAAGFAILLLVGRTSPAAWYAGEWLARVACAAGNGVAGSAIDFRPTYVALPTTGLLLIFWFARWLYSEKRRWPDLVWPVALTLLVQLLYLVLAARLLGWLLPILHATPGHAAEQRSWYEMLLMRIMPKVLLVRIVPWNLPILLFVTAIPVILWGVGLARQTKEPAVPPGSKWLKFVAIIPGLLVSCLLLCHFPHGFHGQPQKPIVFYEKGMLNFLVPVWGEYGPMSVGMFGNLPRFVESLGLTSRKTDQISTATLEGASALVMINLDHALPTTSTDAIWQFVKGGGSLLFLGDHTAWDASGTVHLNEFLAPTAIKFHLDAADTPVGGWLHCMDFQWNPLTANVGDERNEAGIVVGASLDIHWPAYPIVLGRFGWEDRGDRFKPEEAYLGNMAYDADEPLGDTVLVAAQRYGRGKVLVFGDTSSFVNGILPGTYDFVGRVFRWMATPEKWAVGAKTTLALDLGILVLLAISVFLLLWRDPPGRWTLGAVALVAVAVPSIELVYWAVVSSEPLRGQIAYIDESHIPIASEESGRDDGLMGLQMNLMRNGLLPFQLHDFDSRILGGSRLLVLVAPARRFSRRDIETIQRYLVDGGTVILTVGFEEVYASEPLLKAFDIEIENLPLGYFKVDAPVLGVDAMFYEGWPVYDHSREAEMICAHGDFPLIVVKRYGDGRLVVIGDSNFLLNKNLEGEKDYNEVNINFLKALLVHLGLAPEAGK